MTGVACQTVDEAGGAQLAGNAAGFTINGNMPVCIGDPITPHPPFPPHSTTPVMIEGCSNFIINGQPVCREGHKANCGHATTGRNHFIINE